MKVWTQDMFDHADVGADGSLALGTGDFRAVNFKCRHRAVIGPHSILGDDVNLGDHCEIGHHSVVGRRFTSGLYLHVGERTRFGEEAGIGCDATIGGDCTFGAGCRIGTGTRIGDGVVLPERCTLFCVSGALGRSLIKISRDGDPIYYAFLSGVFKEPQIFISTQYNIARPIEEYEREAERAIAQTDDMMRWQETMRRNVAYFRAALSE